MIIVTKKNKLQKYKELNLKKVSAVGFSQAEVSEVNIWLLSIEITMLAKSIQNSLMDWKNPKKASRNRT